MRRHTCRSRASDPRVITTADILKSINELSYGSTCIVQYCAEVPVDLRARKFSNIERSGLSESELVICLVVASVAL